MILPNDFLQVLTGFGDFFAGVPDSQLQQFCQELQAQKGINTRFHIVAANEGNAVALAAGYHLSTGKVATVYMQNSGLGNAVNPVTSLIDPEVYGIPMILVVGWRGEPGIHDEPQHVKMGKITRGQLELLGVEAMVLDGASSMAEVEQFLRRFKDAILPAGKSIAFVVKKGAFGKSSGSFPKFETELVREHAIDRLADSMTENDYVVSTTGKISRELFEHVRKTRPGMSCHDFLTVGSMGHASMLALSCAIQRPTKRIWCFDGDGAVLMHMGSMGTIGSLHPENLIHVIFNNVSHESVGGMPTVGDHVDFLQIAKACGYETVRTIVTEEELNDFLMQDFSQMAKPACIQVMVRTGSRPDLMRPDTSPRQNKEAFMGALHG